MAEIVVLGAGVMGSAFSHLLSDCDHNVCLVGTHLDQAWIQAVMDTGIHPKLRINLFEGRGVTPYFHTRLGETLTDRTELIVLGVSSAGVAWAVEQLGRCLTRPIPIIMLTKGLAAGNDKIEILPDVVRRGLVDLGVSSVPAGAVGGPCIAGELGARRDSTLVLAHPDRDLLDRLVELIDAPYAHVCPSTDIIGVEACAALKNFYALGVGLARGWLDVQEEAANGALMNNPAAGLFVQAVLEMEYLVDHLGGDSASVRGPAGLGDLYVTCQAGRNSRMGRLLGTGLTYQEAKKEHMPDETIEGAELALVIGEVLPRLFDAGRLDPERMPLGVSILEAVCENVPVNIKWDRFYS